ncbi:MAG: protein-glutamate O-methyltransferase CheR, partial [Chrysiogenetes bacterium]|nr:protein-glutamate O-methyltransferase CheR [Chrysiogenetes bacterium]
YGEYYEYVKKDETGAELIQMIDLISTNETRFFREPQQFEYLEHTIIPQLKREAAEGRRDRVLRVWSAACSMGHEPYTIAMVLKEHLCNENNWRVEIIASDISTRVLQQARDGVWDIRAAEQIPQRYLKRYMRRGTNAQIGKMRASPELRAMIRFERVNLNHAKYDVPGQFDLIFCRNALIYFNQQAKVDIVNRLLDRLVPGGYFFLGHAESLANISRRATNVIPAVYQLHAQTAAKPPLRRAAGE